MTSDVDVLDTTDADSGADGGDSVPTDTTDAAPDVTPTELSISLLEPYDGESAHQAFAIRAEVTPPVDGVTVTLGGDGVVLATDRRPPYSALWWVDELDEGEYEVEAIAQLGELSASATVSVLVDHSPPEIAIVEPGTSVFGPAEGTLDAIAEVSDPSGVLRVRFEVVGAPEVDPVVVDAPPYEAAIDVSSLAPGHYLLRVEATDGLGLTTGVDASFASCDGGLVPCLGNCVVPEFFDDSSQHCGGCNLACAAVVEFCDSGACTCAPGLEECDGLCTNVGSSPLHCGACGVTCGEDETCVLGECTTDGATGFATLAPGTFTQGPGPSETFFAQNEFTREVTITRAYRIGLTEVTHAQWDAFFSVNPSAFWDCGAECPVESVNWWEAAAYANARSEDAGLTPCYVFEECNGIRVGNGFECESVSFSAESGNVLDCEGYRLPTEAEWEMANRAGTTSATYAGGLINEDCSLHPHIQAIAWSTCNSDGTPHPVGELEPNALGLYDMSGNVFEWTTDEWISEAESDPVVDPVEVSPGTERPIRGGSWNERLSRVRAATRLSLAPTERLSFVGFRLAQTVTE